MLADRCPCARLASALRQSNRICKNTHSDHTLLRLCYIITPFFTLLLMIHLSAMRITHISNVKRKPPPPLSLPHAHITGTNTWICTQIDKKHLVCAQNKYATKLIRKYHEPIWVGISFLLLASYLCFQAFRRSGGIVSVCFNTHTHTKY